MLLRGLLKLTWLEIKIFVREPLGLLGTVGMPVIVFVVLGRFLGGGRRGIEPPDPEMVATIPVVGGILIALGAVQSLVTIIAIYREGGILKRLRATPLRPATILSAHVLVKLLLTAVSIAAMVAVGRRYLPGDSNVSLVGFLVALLISTLSILSVGFVVASLVPTARFAQPIASLIFYPALALAMIPAQVVPVWLRGLSHLLPVTYAVSLMRGILAGEPWSAHLLDLAGLAAIFAACVALSARVFRWE
jgi:ABC-2 type transport system permease protein